MKRILLYISFLYLSLAGVVYAKEPANSLHQQIKFGPHGGISILSNSAGIFAEYKPNESLGLQTAILYFKNIYTLFSTAVSNGEAAIVETNYISLPLILRAYPGSDRQFCLFMGAKIGYVLRGNFIFGSDIGIKNKDMIELTEDTKNDSTSISLKDINEQNKINRFMLGITLGLDYEFKFGLIMGLNFTKELIDVIESKDSSLNWSLQPTLGFNFGKYFQRTAPPDSYPDNTSFSTVSPL